MATETNPYSGAYGRAAARVIPRSSSTAASTSGPQMSPDGTKVWSPEMNQYVPATAATKKLAEQIASGDIYGAAKTKIDAVATMLIGGATAANNWTVTNYHEDANGNQVPAIIDYSTMQKYLEPMSRPVNDPNRAGGQDTLATWAERNPGAVAFVDKYYPGLLEDLLKTQPESKAALDQVRAGNGPVEVDPTSPGLPAGYTPSSGAQAGADKKAGTITDLRQQLKPGQNAPAPPGRQTIQKLKQKAGSLTDEQRRNRVGALAKRIQDGTALDPAAAMRKINAFQSASIKKAIGPVSAKNQKIFNQVRQARAQGKPVDQAAAKKAAAIKKYRQNEYTKKTGNSLFQTGFKPAPQPTTPGVGAPAGPGQIPDMSGGITIQPPAAPSSTARPGSAPKPNKPNKPNNKPNNKPKGKK